MARHPNDTRPFHFQLFSLYHHRSTMKVGTDSVLLSAWVKLTPDLNVLDVGTGSGIISLLLRSRISLKINAIDIDKESISEASINFSGAPWPDDLRAEVSSLQEYQSEISFDLIISNPPFFTSGYMPDDKRLMNARHAISLTYKELLGHSMRLISPNGRLCVVLPYAEHEDFIGMAETVGFFVQRIQFITPVTGSIPNRVNMELGLLRSEATKELFTIREKDGSFTDQYKDTVGAYYI